MITLQSHLQIEIWITATTVAVLFDFILMVHPPFGRKFNMYPKLAQKIDSQTIKPTVQRMHFSLASVLFRLKTMTKKRLFTNPPKEAVRGKELLQYYHRIPLQSLENSCDHKFFSQKRLLGCPRIQHFSAKQPKHTMYKCTCKPTWLVQYNTVKFCFFPFQCRVHHWDGQGVDGAKALWCYCAIPLWC